MDGICFDKVGQMTGTRDRGCTQVTLSWASLAEVRGWGADKADGLDDDRLITLSSPDIMSASADLCRSGFVGTGSLCEPLC